MSDLSKINFIGRITPWLLGFYFLAIFMLFLAELGVLGLQNYLRATNQVLILLVLLILPVVIMGMSRFIHSLTVKVSGQELHLELVELREDVRVDVSKIEKNLAGQISNAEQTLWPLLAGKDLASDARLSGKKIIIGSKLDSSHLFFGYLLSLSIEKFVPGAQCEVRFPNGGSMKNFADLQNHWIDLYVEYSGTCCQYFNINHKGKTDQDIHQELNYYGDALGLKWLKPFGASEDYCLVMTPKKAEEYQVKTISDLKVHGPQLIFSGDPEFLNRQDCYLGMRKYGIEFKNVKPCRIIDRYELMRSGEADVFVGYETDPQLTTGEALRLADPEHFFPRYLAIPVVNQNAIEKIVGLEDAINRLYMSLTTEDLILAVNKLLKHGNDPDIAKGLAQDVLDRI